MNLLIELKRKIKTNKTVFHSLIILFATILILLIPLIAMQFTNEVNWNLFDFVAAFVLLMWTGLTFVIVTRKRVNFVYKFAVGSALGTAFLMVWTNLAVGIIGNENNPANLMYFGVLGVGIIGSVIERLRAHRMTIVLFVTALANAVAAIIAIIAEWGSPYNGTLEILMVNAFFITLWTISALLFRAAFLYKRQHSF